MPFSPHSLFVALFALVLTLASLSEARRQPRTSSQKVALSSFHVPLSNGKAFRLPSDLMTVPQTFVHEHLSCVKPSPRPQWQKFDANILSTCMLIFIPGSASLTPPASGLHLKAITLGRGTQNYTCSSASAGPVSVGAKADLLDASVLLPHLPKHEADQILNQLPSYLVNLNFDTIENSTIPIMGHHIFSADKVPQFILGKVGTLAGKKAENISAPSQANGVDWLKLDSIAGSVNLKEAYRVETAGGKPPKTCAGQPANIEVPYAAQYWFYG